MEDEQSMLGGNDMLAETFADAVSFANEVEESDVLENEKGAAVKNPKMMTGAYFKSVLFI